MKRPAFSLDEAMRIQREHLEQWRTLLVPEVWDQLVDWTKQETAKVLAGERWTPFDIPRGTDLDGWVQNCAMRRHAAFLEQCQQRLHAAASRPMGEVQAKVLRALVRHGRYPAAWVWGTPHKTIGLLNGLVRRGLVEATEELGLHGPVLTFRPTDAGRKAVQS